MVVGQFVITTIADTITNKLHDLIHPRSGEDAKLSKVAEAARRCSAARCLVTSANGDLAGFEHITIQE